MRWLTVQQPWASLIVQGHKLIENRPWSTDYRGDLAIHAGLGIDKGERASKFMREYLHTDTVLSLPRGGMIGIVELVGVTLQSESKWFTGPIGLMFTNPRRLGEPIPWRGQLGLGNLTLHEERAIRGAIAP